MVARVRFPKRWRAKAHAAVRSRLGSAFLPCSAMASLKGCRSASTDEPVSAGELARLGATMVRRGLALPLLCGGALPHKKLMRSSLRMVLRRFLTHASMSCGPKGSITACSSATLAFKCRRPSSRYLVAALMADLDAAIEAPLMRLHAL